MSEKDTQPPDYSKPTNPAMQTQQPYPPAAVQPQPGMAYQSQGNAYLPQVYPQGAMQPQPPGNPYSPPGNIYVPSGAYPPPGVAYPQHSDQTRDLKSQQPAIQQGVGAPRMYQTAMPIMALNQGAAPVDCPSCGQRAVTRTEYQIGNTTHMWALVLCLFVGLPCIPYFVAASKDVKHSCGNCGVHLATWKRSGYTNVHYHN